MKNINKKEDYKKSFQPQLEDKPTERIRKDKTKEYLIKAIDLIEKCFDDEILRDSMGQYYRDYKAYVRKGRGEK